MQEKYPFKNRMVKPFSALLQKMQEKTLSVLATGELESLSHF